MNKRRIALFIILSLLLSAVVVTAAEPMTDIKNSPHRTAIEQMVELGILSGKGGGLFYPGDSLTRAEAATVAMILSGFDEQDAAQAKTLPQAFDDMYAGVGKHEWALGWINLAAKEGVIAGKGKGKYGPGDNLKMAEWAAILIRILGYETGELGWPTGYDQLASELGLTEGLEYQSNSDIKRDQMAEFTANAVYNVDRSDGTAIIDLFGGRPDEKPGPGPSQQVEELKISLAFSPQVLPEGGGKTSTITVMVTDQAGRPVEDAEVWFVADAFEGDKVSDRKAQLSKTETTTNASGKAVVTYTSLAKDNKKMIYIEASAAKDYMDVNSGPHALLAANQAAVISGIVKNPYNGLPVAGVYMYFATTNNRQGIGETKTDSQGYYSMPVPVGSYYISFEKPEMPIRDEITVNASSAGKTYTANNDKGILKGVVTGVSPGKKVVAMAPGVANGWTLQADIQKDGSFAMALVPATYRLYIYGSSNHFIAGVTVKSGQVTNIGSVKAR